MKFNHNTIGIDGTTYDEEGCQCEENACAWWEHFTSTCGLVTSAFLAGRKATSLERIKESKE